MALVSGTVATRSRPQHLRRRTSGDSVPRWRRPLVLHCVLLFGLLVALAPFMDLHTTWGGDEGSYALEVHSLNHGTWQYSYVAGGFDPPGRWFPLNSAIGGRAFAGHFYPYVKHPLDAVLPWAGGRLLGWRFGYDAPSMLGALLAAASAWLLAAEWKRRAAPLAFWLAAVSPVVFNAYVMWAHALSAGVAGLTAWAAIRCWRRGGDWRWAAGMMAGILAGVFLRAEGLLFGGALAVVTGAALAARGLWRRGVTLAVVGSGLGYAARHIESAVITAIVHRHFIAGPEGAQGPSRSGYAASRLHGGWRDLFAGSEATGHAGHLLAAALILVAIAALALRWRRSSGLWFAAPSLLAALWLYHVRFTENPLEAAMGLFAAWPIAWLALLCLRRVPKWSVPFQLLAVTALFTLGVVATDYAVGGGLEWGGRFFSPALPLLAAVAAGSLVEVLSAMNTPARRTVAGWLLAGVAILPAAYGLHLLRAYRLNKDVFYTELASRSSRVVLIEGEPLRELGRAAWRYDPRIRFMFASNDFEANAAVAALRAASFKDVTLLKLKGHPNVTGAPYTHVTDVTGPVLNYDSWQLFRLTG